MAKGNGGGAGGSGGRGGENHFSSAMSPSTRALYDKFGGLDKISLAANDTYAQLKSAIDSKKIDISQAKDAVRVGFPRLLRNRGANTSYMDKSDYDRIQWKIVNRLYRP